MYVNGSLSHIICNGVASNLKVCGDACVSCLVPFLLLLPMLLLLLPLLTHATLLLLRLLLLLIMMIFTDGASIVSRVMDLKGGSAQEVTNANLGFAHSQ